MDEAAELRSRVINFTAQGNVDDARLLLESALLLDEAARGSLHPVVATDLNSLASILQSQGELETRRSYWERALGIPDKMLPPNHPYILSIRRLSWPNLPPSKNSIPRSL